MRGSEQTGMTSRACQELDFSTCFVFWLNKAPVLQHCSCPVGGRGGVGWVGVGGWRVITRDIPTLIFILKLHTDSLLLESEVSQMQGHSEDEKIYNKQVLVKTIPTTNKHILLYFEAMCAAV